MTRHSILQALGAATTLMAVACSATAHVTLPPGGATAGTEYEAAFRVGHACKDARATTGIVVELPRGFALLKAEPRPGWALTQRPAIHKNGPLGRQGDVMWRAETPEAALAAEQKTEFIVRGKLPPVPGVLWFKVRQLCDLGQTDWVQLPTGAGNEKLPFPAARLHVLAPGVAAVDVQDAWVRPTVAGQSGTGAFMKLSAPSGARLVGVSTSAAGVAEVHEMKMEGDTMKMRPVRGGLELPARQAVELKPSGYHVMLMDLKQPLPKGATVPLTLRFEDAKGVQGTREMSVPVGVPDGVTSPAQGHAH